MNEQTVEMVKREEDGRLLLKETTVYASSLEDVKRQLENLRYQKEALIEHSKRLKAEYMELEAKEKQLKKILEELKPGKDNTLEVLGGEE